MKYFIIIATTFTSIVSSVAMENTHNILRSNQHISLPDNHNKLRCGIIDEGELIPFEPAKDIVHRRIVKFRSGKPLKDSNK